MTCRLLNGQDLELILVGLDSRKGELSVLLDLGSKSLNQVITPASLDWSSPDSGESSSPQPAGKDCPRAESQNSRSPQVYSRTTGYSLSG